MCSRLCAGELGGGNVQSAMWWVACEIIMSALGAIAIPRPRSLTIFQKYNSFTLEKQALQRVLKSCCRKVFLNQN